VGLPTSDEPSLLEETTNNCCGLSLQQRILGLLITAALGLLLFFMSMYLFFTSVVNPGVFAFTFTLANVCFIASSCFIIGPLRQLKMMCDAQRMIATCLYLGSLAFALIAALLLDSWILTFLAVIMEVCAFVWYVFSYIPYGRACLSNTCKGCFSSVSSV